MLYSKTTYCIYIFNYKSSMLSVLTQTMESNAVIIFLLGKIHKFSKICTIRIYMYIKAFLLCFIKA